LLTVRSAAPPGAFRFGGSCVSQGMLGRKFGRAFGRSGRTPCGVVAAWAKTPCPWSFTLRIVLLPALIWAWNIGVLASTRRLSPASPTNPRAPCL
jgi:hypothetical protein